MSKCWECRQVNFIVYILVILFGIGSWIDLNGLWVELPLMITQGRLPEGWKLLSYLSVIIQLANIGPIFVTIIQVCFPGKLKEMPLVSVILGTGSIACLLLAFFWNRTSYFAGEERSTALLVLQFFLALVDCTTSVVFLPFMVLFKPQYMTAYFIGEGLSGLIPSCVALGQGIGSLSCRNITYISEITNKTTHKTEFVFDSPRFPIEQFFLFLFAMMMLSCIAFVLLNCLPYCQHEHVLIAKTDEKRSKKCKFLGAHELTGKISNEESRCKFSEVDGAERDDLKVNVVKMPRTTYIYYLVLTAFINGSQNGVLSAIKTYSCLPYGAEAFHLSATLTKIANPIACFIALFLPTSSVHVISFLSGLGTILIGFILYTAAASPTPILVGTTEGTILIVSVWVSNKLLLTYSAVMITTLFRTEGHRALLWIGAMQQLGSFIGAVVIFILINVVVLFKATPYCSN